MNYNSFSMNGQIVDLVNSRIFPGAITVVDGKINHVKPLMKAENRYIMPGFVDAHIHIESSMLTPAEFARLAVCRGTVATVSDPHEIANVLGIAGIQFMIDNGKKVPFNFYFGAPSCVPATPFETTGAKLDARLVDDLLAMGSIHYLSEMMNYTGVLNNDPEVLKKIASAKKYGKPVDGHAPGLRGDALKKYVAAGITTDHECRTLEEALEKIGLGMMILIREGSAAKDFEALIPLMATHPDRLMFCSDDKHPNELVLGHIDDMVRRALQKGYDLMDVLRAASLNAKRHYHLDVGMLQPGDSADFIVVDNLTDLNIQSTFCKGERLAMHDVTRVPHLHEHPINVFNAEFLKTEDIQKPYQGKPVKMISCSNGSLITEMLIEEPLVEEGNMVSDTSRDLLKMVVYNRYTKAKPAIAFIHGMGLKRGALASSVSHDSHNIVAVGASDADIVQAINLLIGCHGGVVACWEEKVVALPLPVAGLMSLNDGYIVAKIYDQVDQLAHELGSNLDAPFMTMAFMSLLVIPKLKLSDQGLFDTQNFCFVQDA